MKPNPVDSLILQFIAEYHQGLNELAGHGSAKKQFKQQLLAEMLKALPEKIDMKLVAYQKDRQPQFYVAGFNAAIEDFRQALTNLIMGEYK